MAKSCLVYICTVWAYTSSPILWFLCLFAILSALLSQPVDPSSCGNHSGPCYPAAYLYKFGLPWYDGDDWGDCPSLDHEVR